jgi:hypothetical protein
MRAEVVVEVNVANKAALIASAEMVLIAFVLISSSPVQTDGVSLILVAEVSRSKSKI